MCRGGRIGARAARPRSKADLFALFARPAERSATSSSALSSSTSSCGTTSVRSCATRAFLHLSNRRASKREDRERRRDSAASYSFAALTSPLIRSNTLTPSLPSAVAHACVASKSSSARHARGPSESRSSERKRATHHGVRPSEPESLDARSVARAADADERDRLESLVGRCTERGGPAGGR